LTVARDRKEKGWKNDFRSAQHGTSAFNGRNETMTSLKNLWMVLISSVLVFSPAQGQSPIPSLNEIVAKVQGQYDAHGDFKADFVQESLLKSLGRKQVSEGAVFFKKPGKMRWNYQKPFKQEIVSDGKTLWSYRPEEKQVLVSPMSLAAQGKVPSTFLAGLGNLKLDFQVRWGKEPSPQDNYFLELTPNEFQGSLEKLFLLIDRENFRILQAKIQDVMGNTTQISFSKTQFDNRLPDSLFTFTPPKGVEVFQMPGASPPGKTGK
jgi:outer membrane lipoprotein carrier protein